MGHERILVTHDELQKRFGTQSSPIGEASGKVSRSPHNLIFAQRADLTKGKYISGGRPSHAPSSGRSVSTPFSLRKVKFLSACCDRAWPTFYFKDPSEDATTPR